MSKNFNENFSNKKEQIISIFHSTLEQFTKNQEPITTSCFE